MFNFIERLRQKSEKTKKKIALLSALFVAGAIFTVWLSVIYPNFKSNQAKEKKVTSQEPSPVSTFSQIIGDGVSKIKEQMASVKEAVQTFSTDPTYYSTSTNTTTTSTGVASTSPTVSTTTSATSTEKINQ